MASKETSQEEILNTLEIDGTERVRISKRQTLNNQTKWYNFAIPFSSFRTWLSSLVTTAKSIVGIGTPASPIQLDGDVLTPADGTAYTKVSGAKGWNTYVASVQAGNAITVDTTDPSNPIVNAQTIPLADGLLTGGRVTWIQDYDYEVSAATYVIGGVLYTSPLTMITLTPADATLDRIDTFALTTSSTAIAIEGTPSAPPVLEPDVDVTTQLRIAFAYVTAATTQPTPALPEEDIYLENTEWVTAVSAGTWNPNSANSPYAGAKDIEGTAVANNQFITFTPTLFPSLLLFDSFVFKIRSKAAWNAPSRLVFRFYNGTTPIGNAVNFGNATYGFVSATIGSYQNINIPLTDFGNIAAATNLRITKTGTGTIGFYLDNIQLFGNNNVISLPQVNADWAAGTGVSAVLNKELTKTVAAMQALATGGQLLPTMWYNISNPQSAFGRLRIRAISTTDLESQGTLVKNGISYDVKYSLDDGFGAEGFSYLFDSVNQNRLTQYPDGADGIISQTPFNGTYYGNEITGGSYTLSDVTKVTINNCVLYTCTVSLDDNGSTDPVGASISSVFADVGASITVSGNNGGIKSQISTLRLSGNSSASALNGSGISDCAVINSSSISVNDNGADETTGVSNVFVDGNTSLVVNGVSAGVGTTLASCEITGMVGTVTIAGGETYTGKILNKRVSTFDKTRDISAMTGTFDFDVAGYNQSFVGIWNLTTSDASETITDFANHTALYEHLVTFYGQAAKTFTFTDGAGCVMKGGVNAALASEFDYVTFRFIGNVAYETDRGIY